jgi:hypothetical protein
MQIPDVAAKQQRIDVSGCTLGTKMEYHRGTTDNHKMARGKHLTIHLPEDLLEPLCIHGASLVNPFSIGLAAEVNLPFRLA